MRSCPAFAALIPGCGPRSGGVLSLSAQKNTRFGARDIEGVARPAAAGPLALLSRNVYLSPDERAFAPVRYAMLRDSAARIGRTRLIDIIAA
jgi:hypothetical protein